MRQKLSTIRRPFGILLGGLLAVGMMSFIGAVPAGATSPTATATGNSPQTNVTVGVTASVSNIVVTETAAGGVTGTTICVAPNAGETTFAFTGTPSTAASPTTTGAATVTTTAISSGDILVTVAGAPDTTATTFTISGVQVINGPNSGPASAQVSTGGSDCSSDTAVIAASVPVYNSAPNLNTTISGNDIDGTAIAELEKAYPVAPSGTCVPSHTVVLATDQNFPDALSASYLAGYLGTGLLLTPTAGLSSETQGALQAEGITDVYVVGGPLAVSQTTVNEVTSTPAYTCGGPGVGTATGADITVTGPIYGNTQYDTSEDIATTPGNGFVATANLSGAYANQYNDTTGNDSSAPAVAGALRTAIVASGANFPDASAASVMAYYSHFPLILTDPNTLSSQATAAFSALGIQQAIVLGGPLAVSNADVTSIMGENISVIRIAGQDATDTAQMLASFELNQQGSAFTGLGWGSTTGGWGGKILVARGDFYSDALAGSVLAHLGPTPLLLTENPSTVGTYLTAFLNAGGSTAGIDSLNTASGNSGNIHTIQPLGGPLALNEPTLTTMVADVAAG